DGRRKGWQLIWKCDIPPSARNFAWRVAVDSLPTWQNKHKRGLETSELCTLCATELEDNFHPFLRCPLGRNLWHTMAEVWSLPDINMVEHTGKEW
uniref:Reverse transcriptase zinc-binding domain-containing protein n=1 Tax=Triticum urartu TaxID=4572 RepID=A0A8R7P6K3_TRIUA